MDRPPPTPRPVPEPFAAAAGDAPAGRYRPDIEVPPPRLAARPVHRGYPVAWFVAWVAGPDGVPVPEFRGADPVKKRRAVAEGLCWVCGEPLGRMLAFLVGPMCGINRVSAEPPSHYDCAAYSARNCPFLVKPHMARREGGMPAEARDPPGGFITRNPGVSLLWVTRSFRLVPDRGDVLFRFGDPERVEFYRAGRPATRAEVEASVESGLPALAALAAADPDPDAAVAGLAAMVARFRPLLGGLPRG